MTGELTFNLWTFLFLLLFAGLLLAIIRGLRWGIRLLPVAATTRSGLLGAIPLVEIGFGGLFLLLAVERVFRGNPVFAGTAVVGLLFFGLWLSGESLRDVIAGVVLRTGGSIGLGDRVRLDGLEGRVVGLGYRVLTLELGGGDESLVPYGTLSRAAIVRTPLVFGAHRHSFRLGIGADVERIRRTVLLCHWASISRHPVIELVDDEVEVTVFALDPDEGPAVESFVRRHLSS